MEVMEGCVCRLVVDPVEVVRILHSNVLERANDNPIVNVNNILYGH